MNYHLDMMRLALLRSIQSFSVGIFLVAFLSVPAASASGIPQDQTTNPLLTIVQDGKTLKATNHIVQLKKHPFSMIFRFASGSDINMNASFFSKTWRQVKAGMLLAKNPILDPGYCTIESPLNKDKNMFIQDNGGYNCLYYKSPALSRFDSVSVQDNGIVATRSVANVGLFNKDGSFFKNVPIEKMPKNILYMSAVNVIYQFDTQTDTEISKDYFMLRFR